MTSMKKNRVVLGLSGGVDSTAAALLLRERGYDVIGLYFSVKEDSEGLSRAERAAEQLGIELIHRDVRELFGKTVISNFCREYARGRTPNPCVICNPAVKFRTLLEAADETGAYYIATGHYADTYRDEKSDTWYIKRAASEKKDQSYMLYRLGQDVISRLLLPLSGAESKSEVRDMARGRDMSNAEARDSQEICFTDANESYRDFLEKNGVTAKKGKFVDKDGNVLGEHDGIYNYTIGQRKGLGIALGRPAFVTAIDSEKNTVVLGDNDDLFGREVISDGIVLFGRRIACGRKPQETEARSESAETTESETMTAEEARAELAEKAGAGAVSAKIRYAARPAEARINIMDDGKIKTAFTEPQRAATPGQSIVFYKDELVIGGGFIV